MGISHIISFINNVTKFIKSSLYFIAGKLRSFICQSQGHAKSNEGVRLCRPIALSPQVMSPQPKLRRPNIGVVSPQHRGCVAPTSKLRRPNA